MCLFMYSSSFKLVCTSKHQVSENINSIKTLGATVIEHVKTAITQKFKKILNFNICQHLSKSPHTCFAPKLNLILLPQFTDTLKIYPSPVYQIKLSAFPEGILPTLQNHDWNNGTNGEHQLGGENIRLLPLLLQPTNVT